MRGREQERPSGRVCRCAETHQRLADEECAWKTAFAPPVALCACVAAGGGWEHVWGSRFGGAASGRGAWARLRVGLGVPQRESVLGRVGGPFSLWVYLCACLEGVRVCSCVCVSV